MFMATSMLAACGGSQSDTSASDLGDDGAAADTPDETAGDGEDESPEAATCLDPDEATPVTIGIRSSLVFADIYLAQQRGYFADQGLDITLEPVDPATALQLVSSGDVDAVATGLTAGLFNAIDADLDLFPVIAGGNDSEESDAQFWVRTDLIESGEVSDVSDLAGRRFAMPGIIGAGASQKTALYLATGELTFDDVQLQNIEYPDMPGAFANGSIDAAYLTAGASGAIQEADSARPFGEQQITVGVNANTVVFGPRLAEDEAEVGHALLRAVMTARDDLAEGDGRYWESPEIVADLAEATDIDASVVEETARAELPADLSFTPESWEDVQQIYIDAGVLDYDEIKAFEEVAVPSFREATIASRETCG